MIPQETKSTFLKVFQEIVEGIERKGVYTVSGKLHGLKKCFKEV